MIYDDTNSFDAKMDGKVTTSYARAVKTESQLIQDRFHFYNKHQL